MTQKMYEDIFSKRMPVEFFEHLRFVAGETFILSIEKTGDVLGKGGKVEAVYEGEEVLTSILERYGCNWQEEIDDQVTNRNGRGSRFKKSWTNVQKETW